MLNCPIKGAELRQAIKESRKDFGLEEGEDLDQQADDEDDQAAPHSDAVEEE